MTASGVKQRSKMSNLAGILYRQEAGLVAVLLILGFVVTMFNPNFLTTNNLFNLLQTVVVIGIIAIGQTFVLIAGEIDLSVGSILALSAVSTGAAISGGMNPWLALILGVAVGAVSGFVTGAIVVVFKVNSFIVTLGMLSVARGMTQLITGGLPQSLPDEIRFLGQGRLPGGLPFSVLLFVLLVVIGQIVLTQTNFGLRVIATGDSRDAARASGIPVGSTRIWAFVLIGALAGVAGMIFSTQVGVAEAQAGIGYELDVIAAAVIGGASLSGGRGSIVGAFFGACLLGLLRNSFILLALSPFFQQLSIGLVIVLAAVFDQWRQGNLSLGRILARRK